MDALATLLDGPRARGAFLIRSVMKSPWCIRVEDQRVGYGSAFALGAAFKRERGISPQQHRDRLSRMAREDRVKIS